MPSRIVREGINSSARVNALSPLAELFYRRLLLVADDFGRFHGSVVTLRGACWPTNPERVREKDVSKWLTELLKGDSPLVRTYCIGGATYLEIQDFGQQTRSKSRFPEPPWFNIDCKLISDCEQVDSKIPGIVHARRSRISKSYSYTEPEASADADAGKDDTLFPVPPDEEELVIETAKRLCARHPKIRSCGIAEARKKLKSIIRRIPKYERCPKLRRIDSNHEGWCQTHEWTKDAGEFAKGLSNWLSPTEFRYDEEPPPYSGVGQPPPEPRRLMLP
jgi:hypothetical protein